MNDHFAGSVAAVELLNHLISSHRGKTHEQFFIRLREEVAEDQAALHGLLHDLDAEGGDYDVFTNSVFSGILCNWTLSPMPRVFISYSHDSPKHKQRVLALTNQLRANGVNIWVDQYRQDPTRDGAFARPNRQAGVASLYGNSRTAFLGKEASGKGLGATFEGVIIS